MSKIAIVGVASSIPTMRREGRAVGGIRARVLCDLLHRIYQRRAQLEQLFPLPPCEGIESFPLPFVLWFPTRPPIA